MEDGSPPNPKPFSLRIVSIDYYMTPPIHGFDISYSTFHGGNVKELPVIRIYGSTPAGQKACLHIHRVLPYLYVPCSDLGCSNDDEAGSCIHAISLALEKALKLKGNTGSKRQHVHSCSLVRAKKFYGYHSSEELFVKIYFYYPQDVSRASNLLLAGAVLDRVVQPYESHIPFLLQFLIDYNLYGMGHLHVSKLKFRYPVPAVFSPRKGKHNGKSEPQTNDSTNKAGDSQSGLDGDICSNFPIWISSSIPDGWVWPSSEQQDSSENKGTPLFRRQSTSDLEGDALVDEIMNQQFISYAPLSQTLSEVKMVQSLVPIWEEEFERTGLLDAMPSDSGKPSPHEVLRILSDGIEFEKFMEVNNDGEDQFTPTSLETTPRANLLHSGLDNIEHNNRLSSVRSFLSSSASQIVDATNGLQVSSSEVPSSAKAPDEDALRLLKWLASSQAAEDINSDDDLAPQTILSPLLPAKTIEKVLEKANFDYESESQQECQDILDSVDILNLELNGRASNPEKYNQSIEGSSSNVIPQLDGASDDPASTPFADKSSKTDKSETIPSTKIHSCPEQDSSSTCKHRRKRPQMGSLPVFSKKTSNVSSSIMHSSSDGHENDKRRNFGTSLSWSKAEIYPHTLEFDEEKDISDKDQINTIVECSTRDLMRRKRSHRINQCVRASSVESLKTESCFDVKCQKQDQNIGNEETECHQRNISSILEPTTETSLVKSITSSFHNSGHLPLSSNNGCIVSGTMPNSVSQVTVLPLYHGDVHPSKNQHSPVNYDSTLHVSSQIPECSHFSENVNDGEDFSCKDLLQELCGNSFLITSNLDDTSKKDCIGGSQCQGSYYTCKGTDGSSEHCNNIENEPKPLQVCNSASENITKTHESVKLIGMTFSEKPPLIEWTDELDNEAPLLPVDMDTGAGKSLQERYSDVCLPFFTRNFLEEKEPEFILEKREIVDNHDSLKGIPTIYQNDGSCLFMLTPATSPPSTECVAKWLSCDKSDALEQQLDIKLPFRHIFNENAADILDSQNSQSDDNNQSPHHKREINTPHGTREKPLANYSQDASQISGPERKTRQTPLSQIGFRDPASVGGGQQLTLLSIEIQSECRGDLRPDPRFDAINFIILVFQEDEKSRIDVHVLLRRGSACGRKNLDAVSECEVITFTEELDLLNHFIKVIRTTDPDVLMGWDVQSGSLGYLAERAGHLSLGLLNKISRTPSEPNVAPRDSTASQKEMGIENLSDSVTAEVDLQNAVIEDEWGRTHASGVHVGGRIVLNVWRLMRNEVKLNMYTAEAVAEAVLRRKIPFIHWKVLSKWFTSGPARARYRAIEYVLERAKLNLQIMNQLDMINRTSELARVFGIDFFSVLSRGSQYRVESMFLRLAHTQNYLAISPGSKQVASQPAMECLPLVMEPESNFYADPVIVLDFQSLYPSMVIAYNLCFCTCLGKITRSDILGVSSYSPDMKIFRNLKNELLCTPNGVAYVPSNSRKGILPRLLEEILSTRIMVKQAMKKLAPSQQVLHRILNARQLALKLIANVTYGYTAAGFSGRMPCAELADSIVQCGRRTLETAISFVNLNDKWKARVIYGDTDSMFVLLKGRSVKEAFAIGREIASAISDMNPAPVTLKMEKVYYPCFLLTKKRYVGYSYESPDQMKPVFDAKGIETVRRDTCPAVSKTLEKTLRIYFECQDIVKVKAYLVRQWTRILSGRVSLQDFVFAKEVRLGTYSSRASSLPPAAIVASKAMRADPRAEPRYAERVPYVVVHGEPGARLADMVVNPIDILALDSPFRLNDTYYIRKQIIPALQRVFGLVRADLNQWFLEMPRPGRKSVEKSHSLVLNPQKTRIDYYYLSKHCIMCGELVQSSAHLCHECSKNESAVAASLTQRTSKLEKEIHHLAAICRHCGGGDWLIESGVKCISLACSVFYERRKVQKELQSLAEVTARTGFYPKCMVEWF